MTVKMRYFEPQLCHGKDMVWTRKFNGFGFIWTGEQFLSLNYKKFNVPDEICKTMHDLPIQGEFWKHDSLSQVSSVVTRNIPVLGDWYKIYIVPHVVFPSSLIPKEYRIRDEAKFTFRESAEYISYRYDHQYFEEPMPFCNKTDSLSTIKTKYESCLKAIKENKWEGMVVQNLDSYYEDETDFPRSKNTLKIKPNSESNVRIYSYEAGKTGRKIGKVGSFLCFKTWDDEVLSFPNGKEEHIGKIVMFHVAGLTDKECLQVDTLFPKGKLIDFTFKYLSDEGIPQNCNLKRS